MSMEAIFASYATREFTQRRDALCESALRVGFAEVRRLAPSDLDADGFASAHREILQQPRGAGYWLWKPYLIRRTLSRMKPGQVLVYCDAGRDAYYCFKRFPWAVIARMQSGGQGFLLGPAIYQHGPLTRWTKGDCLAVMAANQQALFPRPIIQATWSIWSPTPAAMSFLDQWLHYCSDARCLTDAASRIASDPPDFVDHRHDQSILTLLGYQLDAPYLDFRTTGVFKILRLRPQSRLSHLFLKRIDDAENLIVDGAGVALLRCAYDLYVKSGD